MSGTRAGNLELESAPRHIAQRPRPLGAEDALRAAGAHVPMGTRRAAARGALAQERPTATGPHDAADALDDLFGIWADAPEVDAAIEQLYRERSDLSPN